MRSPTGWLEPGREGDAIDWVVRRPEKHVVSSKIHFATRLHRDPDSWCGGAALCELMRPWLESASGVFSNFDTWKDI